MKRILVLDTGHEWGGGTNSLIELLKRLDRTRFEVTACFYANYARGDSTLELELAAIGIPLRRLPVRRQPRWAKLAKEVLRGLLAWHRPWRNGAVFAVEMAWRIRPRARQLAIWLREGGYDLLYMNNQPSSNLEGYLAAEAAGVHAVQHCRIEPKINAFERAVVNRVARRIVCVSHGVQDALHAQGVNSELTCVIHNAIDGSIAPPEPVALPWGEGIVIGAVGSLIKRKSFNQLIECLPALGENYRLLIVGEGPEFQALTALTQRLGVAGRVLFAGFQKVPLPWIAAMDIFALPSKQEGLPRVVLEAMLLGKPVVASDIVGTRELVVDGETGFLHAWDARETLEDRLRVLGGDSAARRRMGEAGRRRVLDRFGIGHYVAAVSSVLEAG